MSASDVPFATPAGWYPDPSDSARLRRWDGRSWTDDVVIATGTPAPAPSPTAPSVPVASAPASQDPEPEETPKAAAQSLPDWASLPGLTLPPDLSAIPGFSSDPGLPAPSFDEPASFDEPDRAQPPQVPGAPAVRGAGSLAQPGATLANSPAPQSRRELRALREMQGDQPGESAPSGASAPGAVPSSPAPYAPPPSGAQFSAPPPPGVTGAPAPSFTFGMVPSSSLASAALRNEGIENGQPYAARAQAAAGTAPKITERTTVAPQGTNALGVWLIAVLPALQFAILYVVFQTLAQPFIPGTQWGLLAAPAIFSLLFAMLDRRSLLARGQESIPGTIWAIVPPLYLIVRYIKVGARSAVTLIVWILLQAAAVVGAFVLLPGLVASAVSAAAP